MALRLLVLLMVAMEVTLYFPQLHLLAEAVVEPIQLVLATLVVQVVVVTVMLLAVLAVLVRLIKVTLVV